MKTAVLAITKTGSGLAIRLGMLLDADVFLAEKFCPEENNNACRIFPIAGGVPAFTGRIFGSYDRLVYIMACGIVVRSIAPHIRDKRTDPAVVVLDEKGQFAISLLSGHMGGANALAAEISAAIGAQPVITTATDVNRTVAFDVFAKENGCRIENFDQVKDISSILVNGGRIGLFSRYPIQGQMNAGVVTVVLWSSDEFPSSDADGIVVLSPFRQPACEKKQSVFTAHNAGKPVLWIRPVNIVIGIGCKKGKSSSEIRAAFQEFLQVNSISPLSVKMLATADLKAEEPGLLEFCSEMGLPLKVVDREEIRKVEEQFGSSSFVKSVTGVGSVCEPCAVLAGQDARLLFEKTKYNGITLAAAEEQRIFRIS